MELSMYYSHENFIIRSPILPVSHLTQMPEDLKQFFKEMSDKDYFMNCIYTASLPLYGEVIKWKSGEVTSVEDEKRLMLSLFKYWIRMSTRATPFGELAGCTIGFISTSTKIMLKDHHSHNRLTRIDMGFLFKLVETLLQIPEIRNGVKFFPNNSSYTIQDEFRYVDFKTNFKTWFYQISEVRSTEFLQKVLTKAAEGAKINDLAAELVDDEINIQEAQVYINELIANNILLSEIEPTLTGRPFLEKIIEQLESIKNIEPLVANLKLIEATLKNKSSVIEKSQTVNQIFHTSLMLEFDKDILQTDLFLSAYEVSIKREIISEITDTVQNLLKIDFGYTDSFKIFKEKFNQRFEGMEVPITLLLDSEFGIEYDTANISPSLLQGINFNRKQSTESRAINWNSYRDFQFQKLAFALRNSMSEIAISEEDIAELSKNKSYPSPESMSIFGTLLSSNSQEIDDGNWLFLFSFCSGPSGANTIGRFCYGDESIAQMVKAQLEDEEAHHQDIIFAEIIHAPQGRMGNIAFRPILRSFEIPYLTFGCVDTQNQILVSDIYVSVKNDKVILKSKRLGKRIVPRMTTALNHRNTSTLPVFRFLCDLQFQDYQPSCAWDWGILDNCEFLPRVVYRKIILSRAKWVVSRQKCSDLNKVSSGDLINYFRGIRKESSIPRFVSMVEGENELLIDMENENCLVILKEKIIKSLNVHLFEFLTTPENSIVTDASNFKFCHELVIPIQLQRRKYPTSMMEQTSNHIPTGFFTQRTFVPGDRWIYIKVYCGVKIGERILNEVVRPWIQSLEKNKVIHKWFFVRYADPDNHIRIRLLGSHDNFWPLVLNELNLLIRNHITSGFIHKVQIDTYQRELERYGENLIEFSESIFHFDSNTVIRLIGLPEVDEDENFRWLLALRGVDALLDDFGFALESKLTLLKSLSHSYTSEFSPDESIRKDINKKYRMETKRIFEILSSKNETTSDIETANSIFMYRSKMNKSILSEAQFEERKILSNVPSYIHMFLNRIFQSNQRAQEMVVYNFLYRYYQSVIVIKKRNFPK